MVDWNISFIKQCWRYLHSEEASVSQQNRTAGIPLKKRTAGEGGALIPIITTLSRDFDKHLYLKYSYTQMCRWVGIFQKSHGPIVMTLLAPGEEFHLDISPKSCTYPTLVIIDPLEVKLISILIYENNNCPMLFGTFTIDNSSFLTAVKKNCSVYPYL